MSTAAPDLTAAPADPWGPAPDARARRAGVAGLLVWLVVVAIAVLWPQVSLLPPRAGIHAAPFFASWAWHASGWMLLALVAGAALVVLLPRWCRQVPARVLAPLTAAAGSGWAVLVAACGDGLHRVAAPLSSRHEYLPFAGRIDAGPFLRTFVRDAAGYPTHVKGHPPGITLVFWAMDRIGLGGPGWAAVLVLACWALGVGSVVWAVGDVGGIDRARRAAPFVALAPAVVWAATSGDALIAGVTAAGIGLLVAATSPGRSTAAVVAFGAAGGAVLGFALHLSYGVVPLLVVPVAVATVRRRTARLVPAAVATVAGAALVTGAFVAAGFWWLDGLQATRRFYAAGLARLRPYRYFVFGNLGALALTIGPAAGVGFGRLVAQARRRPELALLGGVLVAVLVADLSGMSKAETERIWLPFSLWLSAAGGAVATRTARWWLAASVALGLGLQAWLVTPW